MREMRDSGIDWIGIIPEHWELRRAKSMFKQSTSKGNDRLVLLSATQDRGVVDKSTLDSVVQVSEDADLSTFKTVHKNDFVISLRSFQGGFEISHEEGVISPAYTVFRLTTQTYPHFYRHLFKSYGFIDKINSLTVGIREGKNIQYVDFADMLLPYIPLAEQQRIAEFLDRKCAEVDEMIGMQEQIIEELKAYKQSVITEAVTKGLNPNAPMRDSGIEWIGQIPAHWRVMQFRRLFEIKKTIANALGYDVLSVTQGGLKVKDLSANEGQIAQDYSKYQIVGKDDYVMNHMDLLTGFVDCSTQIGVTSPDYRVFQSICKADISLSYFLRIFQTCYKLKIFYHLGQGVSGMGRWRLPTEQLKLFYLPVPPLIEQLDIADYLDEKCADIDSLIQTKLSKIDSLKEYKKSIIYEYVTGKREVE